MVAVIILPSCTHQKFYGCPLTFQPNQKQYVGPCWALGAWVVGVLGSKAPVRNNGKEKPGYGGGRRPSQPMALGDNACVGTQKGDGPKMGPYTKAPPLLTTCLGEKGIAVPTNLIFFSFEVNNSMALTNLCSPKI